MAAVHVHGTPLHRPLYFLYYLLVITFEVTELNSTTLCHMFRNEPYLKMVAQNFGSLAAKMWGMTTEYFRVVY